MAGQNKIHFQYDIIQGNGNSTITTDKAKLVQILSNLLGNAFKYTREGSIIFGYRSSDDGVEFFVRDTGIGIPEDKLDRIFDRFYQIDNQSSRSYGGAGLGLSICKSYVGLLGGRIWVSSQQGKGSEFCFTHPN
jgi:signal transduction histidine kinase